jgi:VIT1/CCC1 family predicted Fe2+/Mn2+ transporter
VKPKRAKKPLGVIAQVRRAFASGNRLAAVVGLLLGGFVPLAVYVVAHGESGALARSLVAGGLVYSATTVFQWARLAFTSALKSAGFVVLLEGVMVTSNTHWLALAALAYLIAINGVATACTLGEVR